jgi:lipoyl(octanoyl) transferase
MESTIKKAQVVIAAVDSKRQSFSFLLLRTNKKRGGFWQNVTGKLDDGETFEEGGLREAIEETKLKIEALIDLASLDLSYDFVDQRERQVHEECFLLVMEEKWEVKIDPHEHDDFKWLEIESLTRDTVKFESNYQCLVKAQEILTHWGI